MFFRFRQIVDNPFPRQMPRQRLASAAFPGICLAALPGALRSAIDIVIVIPGVFAPVLRILRLPRRLKQRQLLFGQLLALTIALRLQQLAQQVLILVLFGRRAVQLLNQIQHDLSKRVCVPRQSFRIDGH